MILLQLRMHSSLFVEHPEAAVVMARRMRYTEDRMLKSHVTEFVLSRVCVFCPFQVFWMRSVARLCLAQRPSAEYSKEIRGFRE
jgi:hypothetical protein